MTNTEEGTQNPDDDVVYDIEPSIPPENSRLDYTFLHVADKRCDECLFTNNKLVSDVMRDELVRQAVANGSFFCLS